MSALPRTTRRRMFYLMLLLFLVVVPLTILYSQGYIVDFGNQQLRPTGGIFLKTRQAGDRVYIDGVFQRETSFVSRGVLVTNLQPGRYALRVERDGARSWEKVLRVTDGEVLEFRDIFLPPATVTPRVIFNARRNEPARLERLAGRSEIVLTVGDRSRPATVFAIDPLARFAPTNFIRVSHWQWDESSGAFIIGRRAEGRTRWFRFRMSAGSARREEPITFRGLPAGFSADALIPHPTAADFFYFAAGGALFFQGSARVPSPIAEQVATFAVGPDRMYFLSTNGFFVETDLGGQNTKIRGRTGLFIDGERPVEMRITPARDLIILDAAGELFTYQPGRDEELQFVAGNVAGVDFDAAGTRMLYWDQGRLWMYWLRDNTAQPFDISRTKRQIFFSEEPIRQAFLNANGSHVFFLTERGIRVVEADTRGSTNAHDLVVGTVKTFAIDPDTLLLHWVEGSVVKQAELE